MGGVDDGDSAQFASHCSLLSTALLPLSGSGGGRGWCLIKIFFMEAFLSVIKKLKFLILPLTGGGICCIALEKGLLEKTVS